MRLNYTIPSPEEQVWPLPPATFALEFARQAG
jgi:hypothetical protein